MNEVLSTRVLALVTVPPSVEEVLIDALLSNPVTSEFTSLAAHGHGSDHDRLSITEQVTGRRRQTQFQIEVAEGQLAGLFELLRATLPGGDYHCRVLSLHPLSPHGQTLAQPPNPE